MQTNRPWSIIILKLGSSTTTEATFRKSPARPSLSALKREPFFHFKSRCFPRATLRHLAVVFWTTIELTFSIPLLIRAAIFPSSLRQGQEGQREKSCDFGFVRKTKPFCARSLDAVSFSFRRRNASFQGKVITLTANCLCLFPFADEL